MDKVFVSDLKPGCDFASFFAIGSLNFSLTKKGSEYASFDLSDSSGKVPARLWELDPTVKSVLQSSRFVYVRGATETYREAIQVKVLEVSDASSKVQADPELLNSMIEASKYSVPQMWNELVEIYSTFQNIHIKQVAEDILLNPAWSEMFKKAPAATAVHHAFVGGLLEHTLEMCKIGSALLEFPFFKGRLSRDLCLFGLMFHDFGKIFEYSAEPPHKKYPNGIMVGHISMVSAIIYESCVRNKVPEGVRDHMMHVILAHHGKIEYGSPVSMVTPEAVFVHHIDHLHGDVMGMLQKIDKAGDVDLIERDFIWKTFVGKNLRFEQLEINSETGF